MAASIRSGKNRAASALEAAYRGFPLRALALFRCHHENIAGHLGHSRAPALGALRL
jgi:hypothetical protein